MFYTVPMLWKQWKSDKAWKDMTPSQKLSACVVSVGCELSDIAVLLGTTPRHIYKLMKDGTPLKKWEDLMLYRLCGGVPSSRYVTGTIQPMENPESCPEHDVVLMAHMYTMSAAHALAWRINRLCADDNLLSVGDVVVSLGTVYGDATGKCTVDVESPKYLPGAQVNISMYSEDDIPTTVVRCFDGKFSVPSSRIWTGFDSVTIRHVAARAKSFIVTLLNQHVWKKKKRKKDSIMV